MPLKNISRKLRLSVGAGVVFGDVVYEPGASFGPRRQGDYQLVVVVTGEVQARVDGEPLLIAAGQVALLQPGREERFAFSARARTHHTWCAVAPALVDPATGAAVGRAPPVQAVTPEFAQLMELGLGLTARAAEPAAALVQALGWAALQEYLFAGVRAAEADPAARSVAVERALSWIGGHAAEPVDLRGLARRAGVSSAQLVKCFKAQTGDTPMRAVWRARTAQGVQLLQSTGLTIAEVAHRCGFKTPFHFSRWVKAETGCSPREVRRAAWASGRGAGGPVADRRDVGR